jgi:DNA-binding NtrC family response regulator
MMPKLWIVHRDERVRVALARLSAAGNEALLGEPSNRAFETSGPPRVVLLGVEKDLEAELEFAHRHSARIPEARWILLPRPGDAEEVARLFDTLSAEILVFPPSAERLRQRIRRALAARLAEALSARQARDALSARFSRFFADLELPELLRAMDPRLHGIPILVRGEPGSGRSLLAQYVHTFGGGPRGAFVRVPCPALRSVKALRDMIRDSGAETIESRPTTLCLEDLDRLALEVQSELRGWIETAMPPGLASARSLRWVATLGDDGSGSGDHVLDPGLAQSLAGLTIRIPPLRERPLAISDLVSDTVREWCAAQGERPRQFSPSALEAMRDHPWPGNLRELEAVVRQTLAASMADPIQVEQLRFDATEASVAISQPEEPTSEAIGTPSASKDAAIAPPSEPRHEPTPTAEPQPAAPATPGDDVLKRLVNAVSHQVRNPLVTIRTFASLLPERFEDPEFRGRFQALVGSDLGRIERVLDKLSSFAGLESAARAPVDVAALLEQLLEERRSQIQAHRLLVLKEIDRSRPFALAVEGRLRFAIEALLDRALEWVPDRADLYIASKYHPSGLRGGPAVRVLIRFHNPARSGATERGDAAAREAVSLRETSIEIVLAELLIDADGGAVTVDATDAEETVILLDLPAPA